MVCVRLERWVLILRTEMRAEVIEVKRCCHTRGRPWEHQEVESKFVRVTDDLCTNDDNQEPN